VSAHIRPVPGFDMQAGEVYRGVLDQGVLAVQIEAAFAANSYEQAQEALAAVSDAANRTRILASSLEAQIARLRRRETRVRA